MAETILVHYERSVDAPLDAAYAWLTDYQDDDPQRTTKVVKKRPVVSRTEDLVVLDGEIEVLGARFRGRAEVHLFPPDHWQARLFRRNGTRASTFDYRLVPEGPERCRLVVDYHIAARRLRTQLKMWLFKPLVYREIDVMWDGFMASMAKDLTASPPQRATR